TLSYSTLLEELEVNNVRELEDLIIEAIYRNILHAKLDQSNHQLEIDSFIGRDIQLEQLDNMLDKLDQWCSNCASVIQIMEQEMVRANELKSNNNKQKESLEQEIKSLRQAVSVAQDFDQQTTSSSEAFDSQHKFQKKGLRGSLARSKS
ncbi:PREDICTED: COP9 signalosome complex subunit 7b-like, partial [Amphimedon queenslandica]